MDDTVLLAEFEPESAKLVIEYELWLFQARVSPSSPTGRKIVGGENFLLYFWRRVFVSRLTAS
jgi:hypothetical protein